MNLTGNVKLNEWAVRPPKSNKFKSFLRNDRMMDLHTPLHPGLEELCFRCPGLPLYSIRDWVADSPVIPVVASTESNAEVIIA